MFLTEYCRGQRSFYSESNSPDWINVPSLFEGIAVALIIIGIIAHKQVGCFQNFAVPQGLVMMGVGAGILVITTALYRWYSQLTKLPHDITPVFKPTKNQPLWTMMMNGQLIEFPFVKTLPVAQPGHYVCYAVKMGEEVSLWGNFQGTEKPFFLGELKCPIVIFLLIVRNIILRMQLVKNNLNNKSSINGELWKSKK